MDGVIKNRLRVRRAELEVSQEATALKAGLHPNRYWRVEKGLILPTLAECLQIALALNTTAESIFPDFAQRFPEQTVAGGEA